MTPQETESDLPVSVGRSPVEAWVYNGSPQGGGYRQEQSREESLGMSPLQFSRSVVSDSLRPHGPQHARPPCPSPTPQSLPKPMSIESVMPSNRLILYCPLLLLSTFHHIRVFSNELTLYIRWPKYWRFSFSISPSNEYSGLISFRIDWINLLAVQGTLKTLLQHTIQKHKFFGTQPS